MKAHMQLYVEALSSMSLGLYCSFSEILPILAPKSSFTVRQLCASCGIKYGNVSVCPTICLSVCLSVTL